MIGNWPFYDANWLGLRGYTPLAFTNVTNVPSGNGNALRVDSTNTAFMSYRVVESDGTTNLILDHGSLVFWFRPNWSSTNQGGTGPGGWSRFIELGAYTTNASYGFWSIYCDPAGTNIYFGAQTNNGSQATYLSAPISWASNVWHQVALTYSSSNSSLYLDGQPAVTNGLGVSYWPGADVLTNGFFIGSESSGAPATQAHGDFDDLATYNYQLDQPSVNGNFNVFGIVYYGTNLFQFIHSAPSTPSTNSDGGFSAVTGLGYLQYAEAADNCATNGQVYITNVVATPATNGSTTISFSIAGGTTNVAYDVFGAAPLTGNSVTNSQWIWLGQGYTCNVYTLTNQPNLQAYYLLGTPLDSDEDGLTDAYELLVSKTDMHNPDTDGDGISDGREIVGGTDPNDANDFTPLRLGYWRFNTNTWEGEQGQLPMVATNLGIVPAWSGNALVVSNSNPAKLVYRYMESSAYPNINLQNGSIRLWFRPGWRTGNVDLGDWTPLIEAGQYDSNALAGLWSLRVSPAGDSLQLLTQAGGVSTTNLQYDLVWPYDWYSGVWHQVVCTFSRANSTLYIDGEPAIEGTGITHSPGAAALTNGFRLGSAPDGSRQVKGLLDELETFNYQLSSMDISNNYYFLTTPQKLVLQFTNDHVPTNVVSAQVKGVPTAEMAFLINSTNFSSATWMPFASNTVINLGAGDGTREVWCGSHGLENNAMWTMTRIVVDTVPPSIVITNPVASTVGKPQINLSGYSPEALSHVSFDVANTNGVVTDEAGLITTQHYDESTSSFTTNWFTCLDIALTPGTNTITLRASDLAGNATTNTYSYVLDLSGMTNAPTISVNWPQDGAKLGSDTFTLRGTLDDETATIYVSGLTEEPVQGVVERNGTFWVENLSLSTGTNFLTVTAINAAQRTNEATLSLVKSSLQFNMDQVSQEELNSAEVTAHGTINDASNYTLWVNGIKATIDPDNNSWSADAVPINGYGGGTAVFQLTAIPNSSNDGNGSGNDGINPTDAEAVNVSSEAEEPPTVAFGPFNLKYHYVYVDANTCFPGSNDATNYTDADFGMNVFCESAENASYSYLNLDAPTCPGTAMYDISCSLQAPVTLYNGGKSLPGEMDLIQVTATMQEYSPLFTKHRADFGYPQDVSPVNLSILDADPLVVDADNTNAAYTFVAVQKGQSRQLQPINRNKGTPYSTSFALTNVSVQWMVPGVSSNALREIGLLVPLNDSYDKTNHDASGKVIADNQPDATMGYWAKSSDPQLATLNLVFQGPTFDNKLTGTLKLKVENNPGKIKVWIPNGSGSFSELSGSQTFLVSYPSTNVLRIEGMQASVTNQDIVLSATFTPTNSTRSAIKKLPISVVKVDFQADPAQNFGYDKFDPQQYPPYYDFVSVASGSNTTFQATIQPPSAARYIQFVRPGSSVITGGGFVRTGANPIISITANTIAGNNANGFFQACFLSNTGQLCKALSVQVYPLATRAVNYYRVYDSTSTDTLFPSNAANPSGIEISNFASRVWKQAVMQCSVFNAFPDQNVNFDTNQNGIVDIYATGNNTELTALQASLGGANRVAYARAIRMNFRLASDATNGNNFLEIEPGNSLTYIQTNITIGSAVGSGNAYTVSSITTNGTTAVIHLTSNLTADYSKTNTTAYVPSFVGLATDPIIFGMRTDSASLEHIVCHELLHRPSVASLKDLDDQARDNIMYYTVSTNDLLRMRPVLTKYPDVLGGTPGTEQQWNKISR